MQVKQIKVIENNKVIKANNLAIKYTTVPKSRAGQTKTIIRLNIFFFLYK